MVYHYVVDWAKKRLAPHISRRNGSNVALHLDFQQVKEDELRCVAPRLNGDPPLSALCLSGGGIRSAAFSLGVIQALADEPAGRHNAPDHVLIQEIDYLSTVSGGGFIGGWLTAWLSRSGFPGVHRGLTERSGGAEAQPLQWLRANTNYLTPQLGFLSGDTVGAIALSMRNLLLNWSVIVPALAALVILIKIIGVASNWVIFWGHRLDSMALSDLLTRLGVEILSLVGGLIALSFALMFELRCRPGVAPVGPSRSTLALRYLAPSIIAAFCFAHFLCSDAVGVALLKCANAQNAEVPDQKGFCRSGILRETLPPVAVAQPQPLGRDVDVRAGEAASGSAAGPAAKGTAVLGVNELRHQRSTYSAFCMGATCLFYFLLWRRLPKKLRSHGLLDIAAWAARRFRAFVAGEADDPYLSNDSKLAHAARFLVSWLAAGAAYGLMISVGLMLYLKMPDEGFLLPDEQISIPPFYMQIVFGVPWLMVSQIVAQMIFVGLASQALLDSEREWYGYVSGRLLIYGTIWFVLSFVIFSHDIIYSYLGRHSGIFRQIREYSPAIATISGLLSALLAKNAEGIDHGSRFMNIISANLLFLLSAVVFIVAALLVMSAFIDNVVFESDLQQFIRQHADNPINAVVSRAYIDIAKLTFAFAFCALCAGITDYAVNTNFFSLHAVYRNRLIRTYLGASQKYGLRRSNNLTDMDEHDNIKMQDLVRPWDQADWRPFHVLNASLNLLGGDNLAWQERKAMSFTISPLHCGSIDLGYRRSSDYTAGGISLGTAMAISGAAASPNMGSYSSPGKTFFMTLFNMRLGAWLGNPGPPGENTYRKSGPTYALIPLLSEAFGLTSARDAHVHLSDGGHFDNLGLYQMVARGCRAIICVDASHDPKYRFWEIGNAARKVAIDLGVSIDFFGLNDLREQAVDIVGAADARLYFMMGKINYPEGKPGIILYLKPNYQGNEGIAIKGYRERHADFPHEGTSNQWFSESQFESYRMLGHEITRRVLQAAREGSGEQERSLRVYLEALLLMKKDGPRREQLA